MDYEKKYEKLVDAVKVLRDNNPSDEGIQNWVNDNVPELKESEDENIRKELIRAFKSLNTIKVWNGIERADILAWLEKQSYKPLNDTDEDIVQAVKNISTLDLVGPKFHIGDYLVNDYCKGKVIELTDDAYLLDTEQGIPFSYEHNAHLWTIQDAKDGDILSDGTTIFIFHDLLSDGSVMSYCDYDTDSGESDAFCPFSMNLMCSQIAPATEEQRNTLLKAISDAGYTFDFEKKKLKKIHVIDEGKAEMDYCFTKMMSGEKVSSNCSEEDEIEFNHILKTLTSVAKEQETKGYNNLISSINWLKSLKERLQHQWKPSEEQIDALEVAVSSLQSNTLELLYNELKKL